MTGNQFIKKMLKFSVPTIVSAVVGILCLPIISRMYPEDQYGYISQYRAIGTLLRGILLLGFDYAYIRFYKEISDNSNREGMFQYCIKISFISFLVFITIASAFHTDITVWLFNDDDILSFILLSIYIFSMSLFRYQNINYRYLGEVKKYNIQQISFIIGDRLLFIIAVLFSTDYIYAVSIIMMANLMVVIISAIDQRDFYRRGIISETRKKEMLKYALPMMPAALVVIFNNSIAKLIMSAYDLRLEVGVFAIATSAANIFSIIPSAFQVFWGTYILEYYEKDADRIKKVHDFIMAISVLLVILVFVSEDVLYLFLGAAYRSSEPYFMLIMLLPITTLILETTSYGINIAKKTNIILYASLFSCIVNFVACWMLIPIFSAIGAAIGIGLSATISFLIRTVVGQLYYKSIYNIRKTYCSCGAIWGLCISNMVLVDYLYVRIVIALAVLIIELFIYKNYFVYIRNMVKQ